MLNTIIQLTMAGGMIVVCLAIMIPIMNIFLGKSEKTRLRHIEREAYELRIKRYEEEHGPINRRPRLN